MRLLVLVSIALSLLLGACTPPPTQSSGGTRPPDLPSTLGAEDVFTVRVYQEEELSGDFRVGPDGTVRYPLIGVVDVAGKTANEVAGLLQAGLADGYLRNPQVSVVVKEFNSRQISVIGEVKQPGRYPFFNGMTIVDAVAEAGGMSERAAMTSVHVTRNRGNEEQFDVPFRDISLGRAPAFGLMPGDIIVVYESAVK